MTEALATKSKRGSGRKGAVGRLFVLELSGGRIHSMSPDGSDRKVIVTDCHLPGWHRRSMSAPAISTGPTWAPVPRKRWLHRARRHRWKESQGHRSAGWHVHAEADPAR